MTDALPMLPVELKAFGDKAGRLRQWPVRQRLQRIAAEYLATRFEPGVEYRERDVNLILQDWHTFNDWARLRRMLVDWGYLEREPNGARYWVAAAIDPSHEEVAD